MSRWDYVMIGAGVAVIIGLTSMVVYAAKYASDIQEKQQHELFSYCLAAGEAPEVCACTAFGKGCPDE